MLSVLEITGIVSERDLGDFLFPWEYFGRRHRRRRHFGCFLNCVFPKIVPHSCAFNICSEVLYSAVNRIKTVLDENVEWDSAKCQSINPPFLYKTHTFRIHTHTSLHMYIYSFIKHTHLEYTHTLICICTYIPL